MPEWRGAVERIFVFVVGESIEESAAKSGNIPCPWRPEEEEGDITDGDWWVIAICRGGNLCFLLKAFGFTSRYSRTVCGLVLSSQSFVEYLGSTIFSIDVGLPQCHSIDFPGTYDVYVCEAAGLTAWTLQRTLLQLNHMHSQLLYTAQCGYDQVSNIVIYSIFK